MQYRISNLPFVTGEFAGRILWMRHSRSAPEVR